MGNAVNIVYAMLLMGWGFQHPTRYVLGYIVYVSSYFGWFSHDILVGGVEYGQFLFNVLALVPVVLHWEEIEPKMKTLMVFLFLFYLYGLMKPVWDGHQGWVLSVKSSKSVTAYFFLFYVLAFYRRLDFERIFRFLTGLSLYYALLYIVNSVGMDIRPPMYVKNQFLQCPYDSFLLLSFCYLLSKEEEETRLQRFLVMGILAAGIYLGGYFSLFAATLFVGAVVAVYRGMHTSLIVFLTVVGVVLFLLYEPLFEQAFTQLWNNQQSALDSRSRYNEFRWVLIAREFWGGYGFLSRDTRLVSLSAAGDSSGYMMDLSFIDAGYVDMMGRFGLIGTLLFLLAPVYILLTAPAGRQQLPFRLLVMSFYAVNMTWSVFTFPQGIIVLGLVYACLYQNLNIESKWQES